MDLATATRYAESILKWIGPHCRRAEVAGSVRRGRPECADVDIVCEPLVRIEKDMLGAETGRRNLLLEFLQRYVAGEHELGRATGRTIGPDGRRTPYFVSGGEKEGKQVILQLPKCQLDLWFADEMTWGTRLLCRTGSKEHNIWLCDRAVDRGGKWSPYEGLEVHGVKLPCPTEDCIYAGLGLKFIEPKNREEKWLRENVEQNL
jgi:DNA polymerase/3'-5' exonuclease PolX